MTVLEYFNSSEQRQNMENVLLINQERTMGQNLTIGLIMRCLYYLVSQHTCVQNVNRVK